MYTEFFRLRENPFNITPDPRFLYLTAQHREALNHLLYGIRERKGFICLTGEVGTGKTTLCRALLRDLGERYHTALVLNPMLSQTQLLRCIVDEFGIETRRRDRLGLLSVLNRFLLEATSSDRDAVLIIDEAQDVSTRNLELIRLLSNLETDSQKLLQICLVGQPELREKLAKPELRQLAQRITVRFHLAAMDEGDTEQYLQHRLRIAGDTRNETVRFEPGAVREIHAFSRGTPRLINALGDKAMLAGYVYRTTRINRTIVRIAADELREAG
jgi:general secretion pathway protein A